MTEYIYMYIYIYKLFCPTRDLTAIDLYIYICIYIHMDRVWGIELSCRCSYVVPCRECAFIVIERLQYTSTCIGASR